MLLNATVVTIHSLQGEVGGMGSLSLLATTLDPVGRLLPLLLLPDVDLILLTLGQE